VSDVASETLPASLSAALVLAAVYVIGSAVLERAERASGRTRRRLLSAAAGVSVAYVFVDALPELGAQHLAFVEAVGEEGLLFAEERIYFLALVSFVVLYGLEHMVLVSRERRRETVSAGESDAVYWLHLAGYAAYSGLIGYLLVERAERGTGALAVYTLAMTVHFLIVDHSLNEEHGEAFRKTGRWVLTASVLGGWLLALNTPLSEALFARLFAVLAGGVVITSLSAELPDDRQGRFWPFSSSAAAFAVLLFLA
jgi:hypothetical protein